MRRLQFLLALFLLAGSALAYETDVHRKITSSAFLLAAGQNGFMSRIGATETSRFGYPPMTAEQIAAEGSHLEDDLSNFPVPRPLNHFFEPVGQKPLMAPPFACFMPGQRADTWAIDGFLNSWSIADARSHLRTAITGPTPGVRDLAYRDLFRSIGQFVHLVQDMAQPEHTRNDQHVVGSGMPNGRCTPGSLYEAWTLAHLTGANAIPEAQNFFAGFEVVRLPSYSAYFRFEGKGLAEFSNRNFVTQDTNYDSYGTWSLLTGRCAAFTEPQLAAAAPRVENITETVVNDPCCPGPTTVTIPEYVFSYAAYDAYKQIAPVDQYHTHLSAINHEISLISQSDPLDGGEGIFSLSNHSYRSRAAILIPRAVEYSAGLIDRFFRGKISVSWAQNPNDTWNLTITNDSAERIGTEARVTAVYKATPQYFNRTTTEDTEVIIDDILAGIFPGFDGLEPGETVTIPNLFVPSLHDGDSLMQFERRIAVIGSLGDEPQAVIPVIDGASGRRVRVDASPALITATLRCAAFNPPATRLIPLAIGVEKEFALAGNEECRVLLQHVERPAIGFEGTPTTIRLRVWRGSNATEDLSATIDAGDVALGGCHRSGIDGHCDRFIQRTGSCVFQAGYLNNTRCFTTSAQWDWGTGPY